MIPLSGYTSPPNDNSAAAFRVASVWIWASAEKNVGGKKMIHLEKVSTMAPVHAMVLTAWGVLRGWYVPG